MTVRLGPVPFAIAISLGAACADPAASAAAPAPTAAPAPAPAPVATTGVKPLVGSDLRGFLSKGTGKVRVVNFWATWCGPCVHELPMLAAFAKQTPDVQVQIVSLDARSAAKKVDDFVAKLDAPELDAWRVDDADPGGVLATALPTWQSVVPVTLVLDGNGVVRQQFDGEVNAPMLVEAIAAAGK